jgi:beta-phosphoglucomutase
MEQGYIFDLDGVITDTVRHHYSSWQQLAAELGIKFTIQDNDLLRGRSRSDALTLFLKGRRVPDHERQRLLQRKNELFLERISGLGPRDLLPGVLALLTEAREAGIRIGVASASHNARLVCRRLGITPLLDALADGYSVTNPKPAPDIFLWTAGRLDCRPANCVVFEDAAAGVSAALAGGFFTVGLGPQERLGSAQLVRPDLTDARVDDFQPQLAPAGS